MKACVLEGISQLKYKDVEIPVMKKGEVLVNVKACGICSSDIPRIFTTGTYHFPTIPGHEFCGQIVDAAEDVDKSYIGKRAVIFPLLPCGECPSCKEKEYARCDNYNYFGSRCDGGMAEYISVPLWNIVTFSDDIPYNTAALTEPMAVARHATRRADINNDKRVLVMGNGTIGLLAALIAQKEAKQVIVAGRSKEKEEFTKSVGLENVVDTNSDLKEQIDKITDGNGVDVVIECVGSNDSIESSILTVKKGGTIVLTGNPYGDLNLPKASYWKILRKELTVKGTWNSSYNDTCNDWKDCIKMIENGEIDISKLVTHAFKMEDYEHALDVLRDKNVLTCKVMLNP